MAWQRGTPHATATRTEDRLTPSSLPFPSVVLYDIAYIPLIDCAPSDRNTSMVFYECVLQVKHHTSEWAKGGMDGQKIDHVRVLDGFFLTSGLPLFSFR